METEEEYVLGSERVVLNWVVGESRRDGTAPRERVQGCRVVAAACSMCSALMAFMTGVHPCIVSMDVQLAALG